MNSKTQLLVGFIGFVMWYNLIYYGIIFSRWQAEYFLESNSILKGVLVFIFCLFFILNFFNILFASIFISFNKKLFEAIYCLCGIVASYRAINYFYNFKSSIFEIMEYAGLTIVSKSLTLGLYGSITLLFVIKGCLFPYITRK